MSQAEGRPVLPANGAVPMDVPPIPNPDDEDPGRIADAEALFRDAPAPRREGPSSVVPASGPVGDYEVGGHAEADAPRLVPVASAVGPDHEVSRPKRATSTKPRMDPSEAVEQVWSRWAEWGGTLLVLLVTGFGLLAGVYALVASESYGPAFVLLAASVPVLVFLAYPILITLERPVRVTPEQAVRDYVSALSHHFPHYHRMWLLLSNAGRVSGEYASFGGFREYWKRRLAALRAGRASALTPLKFQVVDFKSEKSAGLSAIDATFTVNVSVRGRQKEGPIESIRVAMSLVKGPDRMWYLDRGTLP